MSEAIHIFPMYALMVWKGKNFIFTLLYLSYCAEVLFAEEVGLKKLSTLLSRSMGIINLLILWVVA
jgi:hypothetical protein